MSFSITPQGPEAGPNENNQAKSAVTLTGTVKLDTLAKLANKHVYNLLVLFKTTYT
jgi:hypothetical protein